MNLSTGAVVRVYSDPDTYRDTPSIWSIRRSRSSSQWALPAEDQEYGVSGPRRTKRRSMFQPLSDESLAKVLLAGMAVERSAWRRPGQGRQHGCGQYCRCGSWVIRAASWLVLPSSAAPPGDPRSTKNSALTVGQEAYSMGGRLRRRSLRPGMRARMRRSRHIRRDGCRASGCPRRCSRPGIRRCRPCPGHRRTVRPRRRSWVVLVSVGPRCRVENAR